MKYGNISEIAQYNRENGTNFYTMEQVEKHKRKNSAEEFEKKHSFLASLSKSAQEARDARIGAIGAGQVRDLYNKGENELASELNNKYLEANASGILSAPMAGEFVTYGPLVGALRLGAGTAGSAAGSYIAGKAGDFADKKLGTNWIGNTGRLLGGFAGFGAGMKTTTPLIRSAATRGITLHMPQNTFMKVRGEGFDRAFNKINTNPTTEMKLAIRDDMMDNYLSFGSRNGEPNRFIHWDPMTIGTKKALPINGGIKLPETKFTHISGDSFVPAEGEITSKVGGRAFITHTSNEHPIFFGKNQPWREVPQKALDTYLSDIHPDKSIYSGPKQNFKRWWKRQRLNAKHHGQWYDKYGLQNEGQRYLTVNPKDVSYIDNENIGVMVPKVELSKVEGFEYDPTTSTFNKVRYVNTPKQTRVVSEGTYPLYTGPKHSVTEVVNPDGTVNPRAALRIEREVADNIPGAYRMESRLENPEWHINDPNTWAHTRNVAQSAWTIPTPKGLTKQDQMVAALGHDFGKMVSGDGHAQSSAALIEQIFPDVTEQQLTAISEHMGTPKSILGKVTKQADILNGRPAITRFVGDNGKIRLRLPSHTIEKPRELVLDPQGNNKFRVHTRTWDGDHIPAEMSGEDKNTLFNALYEELPEGAEILFPESGPGNYATRGTVAGLQRLARDSRFKPTGNGVLQYVDKDGSIQTFEGTGFRKPKSIKLVSKPISEAERLGIPKGERSNPQALEDPQYWGYKQWNDRYNAAVESENIEEAQRLRDLHFKQKSPNAPKQDFYHGTNTKFNIFDKNYIGSGTDPGWFGRGFYFSPNEDYALGYAKSLNGENIVLKTKLNIKKPLYIDAENGNAYGQFKIPEVNDGVFVRLGDPEIKLDPNIKYDPNEIVEVVARKPNQIKLSNPITYTDNGKVIQIIKRDNFHNPDMRYKQGGILKAQKGTIIGKSASSQMIPKKLFELVAKRSNNAQTKSIPTIVKDVITGRDKSFYNDNNINGSNEIDTYLYGKPYNSEFTGDTSIGPDYTNYINRNYPNRNIKTYNTHFGDTLYIDNKAKSLVERQLNNKEVVGGSMGRYAHAPSYIVTKEDGRPYDAGGHLMKFSRDGNGNIVANMSDIYDFLPEDFNHKYDQTKNPSWTRYIANNIGNPFIVRQNNIPVIFKEIVPEYKTDRQRDLGDFLSQWGNTYDLKLPLKLTDEQIDEIFDGRDYGDEILDFMQSKGYIK